MQARGEDIVALGKVLDEFDVAGEAGAGEDAFEEVVAENAALGRATVERRAEGIDIIDALALVDALVEDVLIDVGNRSRIGIDAGGRREELLKPRAFRADGKGRGDARLHDAVALDDPPEARIEAGPVEDVGHLADQPADRLARHARVRIERDDVADSARNRGRLAVNGYEAGVVGTAEQPVELLELAALALPAHPLLLGGVPLPAAMEKQEAVAGDAASVAPVETGDAGLGAGEQRVVAVGLLAGRVRPVAEERIGDVAVLVGEVVNLDTLDQLLDAA